jgi:glycosyltransferase involved in cell wall biosynthesis
LRLPQDKKIILYSGQFVSWKGLEILEEASRRLPANMLIYVVGGEREDYEKITGIKVESGNLIFAGLRDYKEMPLWNYAADICLVIGTRQNEYSYYHTSPMKIFENMASLRPILASDTPANREIVSEKECYFYEPDNAEDLALKAQEILKNPIEADLRINCALIKVREYSWEKRAKNILELINENK